MRYDPRLAQLRGGAALSVALYHLWTLSLVPLAILRPGWLGVPLFLQLSIFLMLNRLDANPSLGHYFRRRIRRIWPLYFASVTVVFLYEWHIGIGVTLRDLLLHYAFLSFVLAPLSFNYVFWTLQLEEWMYVFIPLIHRLSTAWKRRLAAALIYSSIVYGIWAVLQPYPVFHTLFFLPPFWLGAYGWGILAYTWRDHAPRTRLHLLAYPVAITLYVLAATYLNGPAYQFAVRVVIYNALLPVFAMTILSPPRVLHRATVFLGEVSYGIYVWHLLFEWVFGAPGILAGIAAAVVTELPLRRKEILGRVAADL
jgi:peptidoglycan/LPS O-acetylase OafA/YrhL